MRDQTMTNGLVCTWLLVTDDAGRAHMEAHWTASVAVAVAASAPYAA